MGLSIGQMPRARPLEDDDLFEVVQDGINRCFTGQQLRQLIQTGQRVRTVAGVTPDVSGDVPLTAADLGLAGAVKKVAGKAPDAAGNVPLTAADLGLKGMVAKVAGKAPDATGNVPLTAADLGLAGAVKKVAGKAPDAAGNVPLTAADLGLKGMVAKVAGKAPDATGNVPLTAADLGLGSTVEGPWIEPDMLTASFTPGGRDGWTMPGAIGHERRVRFRQVGQRIYVDGCVYCKGGTPSGVGIFSLTETFAPQWSRRLSAIYKAYSSTYSRPVPIEIRRVNGYVLLGDSIPEQGTLFLSCSFDLD
ncbi:hypothetical protein KUU23_20890 [Pseudomonas aeruginosa]|nr:hypothetical protein [Pseudomonas aeruginosa]MBV5661886.1 hypothetical protein [Pseudomonas aeruginosa]